MAKAKKLSEFQKLGQQIQFLRKDMGLKGARLTATKYSTVQRRKVELAKLKEKRKELKKRGMRDIRTPYARAVERLKEDGYERYKRIPRKSNPSTPMLGALILGGIIGHSMKK